MVHGFLEFLSFRVSYGVDGFCVKLLFWFGFMLSTILFFVLFFFCYGRMVYGFRDLAGFRSSSTVHGYLEYWWFRGFLNVCLILGQTTILWFYAFDCFSFFIFYFFIFGLGMDT